MIASVNGREIAVGTTLVQLHDAGIGEIDIRRARYGIHRGDRREAKYTKGGPEEMYEGGRSEYVHITIIGLMSMQNVVINLPACHTYLPAAPCRTCRTLPRRAASCRICRILPRRRRSR